MRCALFFLAAAGLLCAAILPCRAADVYWGSAGVSATNGYLDASRIPLTTGTAPVRYTNVNGEGYDIVVTTANLSQDGVGDYGIGDAWWFAGTDPTRTVYGTITFQFFVTGTNVPLGLSGADIFFEDAEDQERFNNFSYDDEFGNQVPELFNAPMFIYSNGADYFSDYTEVANAAPQEGGTQDDEAIEINLTATTITGFTIGSHRQTTAAGSVLMTGLGDLTEPPIVQWRQQYFGLNLSTESIAGDSANPSGDGIPNLLKYAFGLDPTMRETTGLPVVSTDTGYLVISFNVIDSDTDITYIVQTSYDLVNWTDGSTYSALGNIPDLNDTYQVSDFSFNGIDNVVVSDTVALASTPFRFIRVLVTRP